MRRCLILAVIVAIGCGHDREPEKRVAPAAVNPPIPPDDDHEDPNAPIPPPLQLVREANLPPRTPCKTPCDTWHDPEYATWSKKCIQTAPGIVVFGQDSMHLAGCSPLRIVIDCCTINRDDTAVARTLGWEHATPDQRVSIAWVIARMVEMMPIREHVDEMFRDPTQFTPPTARLLPDGGVELDFWIERFVDELGGQLRRVHVDFDNAAKVTQTAVTKINVH